MINKTSLKISAIAVLCLLVLMNMTLGLKDAKAFSLFDIFKGMNSKSVTQIEKSSSSCSVTSTGSIIGLCNNVNRQTQSNPQNLRKYHYSLSFETGHNPFF